MSDASDSLAANPSAPRDVGRAALFAAIHGVGWLAVLLVAGLLGIDPPQWLDCRCGFGPVKYNAARIAYGLIAARAAVAVVLRERSAGWLAHLLVLPWVALFVAAVVVEAGGH